MSKSSYYLLTTLGALTAIAVLLLNFIGFISPYLPGDIIHRLLVPVCYIAGVVIYFISVFKAEEKRNSFLFLLAIILMAGSLYFMYGI